MITDITHNVGQRLTPFFKEITSTPKYSNIKVYLTSNLLLSLIHKLFKSIRWLKNYLPITEEFEDDNCSDGSWELTGVESTTGRGGGGAGAFLFLGPLVADDSELVLFTDGNVEDETEFLLETVHILKPDGGHSKSFRVDSGDSLRIEAS